MKKVYFGAIPERVLASGIKMLKSLVEAEGARREQQVRRAPRSRATSSPRSSGAPPWPSTRCSASAIAPDGRAMTTWRSARRQRGERNHDPREQQQDNVEAVARGEVDLGAQASRQREPDAGGADRSEQQGARRPRARRASCRRGARQGAARPRVMTTTWMISVTRTPAIFAPTRRRWPRGVTWRRRSTPDERSKPVAIERATSEVDSTQSARMPGAMKFDAMGVRRWTSRA